MSETLSGVSVAAAPNLAGTVRNGTTRRPGTVRTRVDFHLLGLTARRLEPRVVQSASRPATAWRV